MRHFDFALRVRGWQVFLGLLATAVVAVASLAPSFDLASQWSKASTATLVLLEVVYFGWGLAVTAAMNTYVPPLRRRALRVPALGLLIAVAYLGLGAPLLFSGSLQPGWYALLVPLHLLGMAVNFYLLWVTSSSIVEAERHRGINGMDTFGTFIALWFTIPVPVGAWWVHNRARRVAGLEPIVAQRLRGRA